MADYSGTITSGGNAQTIATFNSARTGLIIQNPSDADLWVRFGGTAAAASPSIYVAPGETLTMGEGFRQLIVQHISIFGGTTGKAFTAIDSGT